VACPLEGVIKINVDAAFEANQHASGIEAIARDLRGKFLMASCKELHFVTDAFMDEAYALCEGLSLAQHFGSNNFIIQSKNIQMIDTIKNGVFW
jgi:hypothetical protein